MNNSSEPREPEGIIQSDNVLQSTSNFLPNDPYYEMICAYGNRGFQYSERCYMWFALQLVGGSYELHLRV
jgi:hypothetical protein